jgi:hypothetical protein
MAELQRKADAVERYYFEMVWIDGKSQAEIESANQAGNGENVSEE